MVDQAIVHVVRGGGARTVKRICSQMEYLTRRGDLQLQFSERHGAGYVPYDETPEWARRWAEQAGNFIDGENVGVGEQEMTTHIVVSFPPGTDEDGALRAGRHWAEAMFGASHIADEDRGNSDEFDYLTAFHTDRDHPHVHVMVNRRSLRQNLQTNKHEWLKIAQRNTRINYDVMRAQLVLSARLQGIRLEATRRQDRGIPTRSLTTEQFRMNARRRVGIHEHWEAETVAVLGTDLHAWPGAMESSDGPSTARPGVHRPGGGASGSNGAVSLEEDRRVEIQRQLIAQLGTDRRRDEESAAGPSPQTHDSNGSASGTSVSRDTVAPEEERLQAQRQLLLPAQADDAGNAAGISPPEQVASGSGNAASGPGSGAPRDARNTPTLDDERRLEAQTQRQAHARADHRRREQDDAEGDRDRRRVPVATSVLVAESRRNGDAPDDRELQPQFPHPSPAPPGSFPSSKGNADLQQEAAYGRNVEPPPASGSGGGGASGQDRPVTAEEAAALRAAARARRRGDNLERVVRTRAQTASDEQQRVRDGPISGRVRRNKRVPDRSR